MCQLCVCTNMHSTCYPSLRLLEKQKAPSDGAFFYGLVTDLMTQKSPLIRVF
jgi:hypothetical protein